MTSVNVFFIDECKTSLSCKTLYCETYFMESVVQNMTAQKVQSDLDLQRLTMRNISFEITSEMPNFKS